MSRRSRLQLAFGFYAAVMLYLLLFGRTAYETSAELTYGQLMASNVNLVPFRSIGILLHAAQYYREQLGSDYYVWFAVKNIGGNLVLFVPLGLFLPALWQRQRKYWLFLLTVAGAICLVEVTQLLTLLGSLDIDDLILNTVGATLGYLLWLAFRKKTHKPQ